MHILWRRVGGGGGRGVQSECIQYGELENRKWENKVQGNAGKVKASLGGNEALHVDSFREFLKINSLVCYQWPKVSGRRVMYDSDSVLLHLIIPQLTQKHCSLFVCLTIYKMDISLRRTPLEPAVSVQDWCPPYRESNKASKERQGLTLGVGRSTEVSILIEVPDCCGYPVVLQRWSNAVNESNNTLRVSHFVRFNNENIWYCLPFR